ncbi:MAG: GHKL domain-containing protein [Lachnospiraceae bacterium]
MTQNFAVGFVTILGYAGCIWTAVGFCRKYLSFSAVKGRVFAALFFCSWVMIRILWKPYVMLPDIFLAIGSHLLVIGAVLLLFQGGTEKKILVASILVAVTTLTETFCVSLLACLTVVWKHTQDHTLVPFVDSFEVEGRVITLAALLAVMAVVYWMSKRHISFLDGMETDPGGRKLLTAQTGAKRSKGYVILAVPLLAVTLVIDVANWGAAHGILVRSGGNMGLYYDQIFSYSEFMILSLLSMFAAGSYMLGIDRIYLEQRKNSQYYAQIAAYQMLETQYRQTERLRHDMKNHVIALSGLLENREWEKMDAYLDSMTKSAGIKEQEEVTGNKVVDALLHQKRQIAQNRKIRWECDVQIPGSCGINEFDLCTLFGNLLDNAVEACERLQESGAVDDTQRFIDIQAKIVKRCFLLEMKNSAGLLDERKIRKITGTADSGAKASFRKDAGRKVLDREGIGLSNIRDMVSRYNGAMKMDIRDGIFQISVLVPLADDSIENGKR